MRRLRKDLASQLGQHRSGAARRDAAARAVASELKRMLKWAEQSQQAPRLRAAREVVATFRAIAVLVDELDSDPWLLNLHNGTLDLRSGELRPHRRDDLITKLCAANYENVPCPTWEAFLERIFAGRKDLIEFVRRAVGYSLTGVTTEQCFFVCHGIGANGKSTFLEALRYVLCDYARATGTDTLLRVRAMRGAENDIARLRGTRFVSAVESGEGRQLDEERVKRLTGGDTVTARYLYREYFEFVPTFKIWLAVNDRPEITGIDHGVWRRIRLIPFDVVIPDAEQDKQLSAKLCAEAPGILHWAVRGCLEWQQKGLLPPAQVVEATADWRCDSDLVGRFLDERCRRGENLCVRASALQGACAAWCEEQGLEPVRGKAMARRLRFHGLRPGRCAGHRLWSGVELLPAAEVTQ